MTSETAAFLLSILNTCSISVGDANFEQTAASMAQAKRELLDALDPA